MQNQNTSDIIELYLKQLLADQPNIEIRRAEVAQQFNCVPSQINYVINTRFTPERGYIIKSKRGGGGYIRIEKVRLREDQSLVELMQAHLPPHIRQTDAQALVQQLFDAGVVSQQTGNLMLTAMDHQTLRLTNRDAEDQLRAQLMNAFLDTLRYDR